jgi:cytochrome c-type biogenesis protein CcsB
MNWQIIFFYACTSCVFLSIITSLFSVFRKKIPARQPHAGSLPSDAGTLPTETGDLPAETGDLPANAGELPADVNVKTGFAGLDKTALVLTVASFAFMSAFIAVRIIATGHGPFTSMYEFAIAFVWGILLMGMLFSWRYRSLIINLAGMVVSSILLIYAGSLSTQASPLVPALQNSILLSSHVASAVIAYGAFTISFATSVFYMIQKGNRYAFLPDSSTLENISYRSVIIGFPFMTLVIVLGALWADIAWGRFWGWDPKETASLVTWLIYAGYLHTRILRGWRGRKTAILLIVGFVAVILTFFGNYIFNGLHAYG